MWYPSPKHISRVYFGALIVAAAGVHFSPALSSIGLIIMIAVGIGVLLGEASERRLRNLQIAFLGLMGVMLILDMFAGNSIQGSFSAIQVMIPWFFLPAICVVPKILPSYPEKLLMVLAIPLWWISGASMLNYTADFEFLSQMVLESKPLPLYTEVYHIEFSLLLTVVLLGMTFVFSEVLVKKAGFTFYSIYILLFISLHMVSARTGLLSYWLGMGIWVIYQLKSKSVWQKIKPIYAIGIFIFILISLMQIPSLKNRMVNTTEDLRVLVNGGDVNHKSLGQRVEAWKAIMGIIAQPDNFLTGVGSTQFESVLFESYERQNSKLFLSNRIGPHNQTLQWMATYGFPVTVIWYALLIVLLGSQLGLMGSLMLGVPIWAASMFESIAQRQAGTLSVILVCAVFQTIVQYRENNKKISAIN